MVEMLSLFSLSLKKRADEKSVLTSLRRLYYYQQGLGPQQYFR